MKKIVKFSTIYCGPCKVLSPIFKKVALNTPNIIFEEIDCDDNAELAKSLGIRGVPTLILFENDIEIKRNVGLISEQELIKFLS